MKKEELVAFIANTNKSNITEKMTSISSHVYSLNVIVETLEDKIRNQKLELEVIESKFYRDISTTYKNVRSMTPTTIGHHINCKDEVISKKKEILESQKKLGLAKSKLRALMIFSEMLTNVGHNYRNEKNTIKKGV